MAYIGKGLDNGVRNQFIFAATQGQTAFSGADSDGKTLAISDILYTDCFQNGVKLEPTTDYTVTLTSLTLVNAASLNDVVDIVSFDIFAVPDTVPASTGGTFNGAISATSYGAVSGTTGTFSSNFKVAGGDLIVDQTNNGYSGLRIHDDSDDDYNSYLDLGRDQGATRLTIRRGGRTQGATPWANATATPIVSFARGGIAFGTDTAAVNTLDDYEEGTWTPSDQSGAGMSLTVWEAFYTKIGRKVYVEIGFLIPTNSSTADVSIGGLPFTAKSGNDNTGGFARVGGNSGRDDQWQVNRGQTKMGASTNSGVSGKNNEYSNKQIKLCGSYTTA